MNSESILNLSNDLILKIEKMQIYHKMCNYHSNIINNFSIEFELSDGSSKDKCKCKEFKLPIENFKVWRNGEYKKIRDIKLEDYW